MEYFAALALACGFAVPVAVLSGALGQGRAGAAALEGIARQPEAAGPIRGSLILTLALIESLVIYALLVFFMLQGKLPPTEEILKIIGGGH